MSYKKSILSKINICYEYWDSQLIRIVIIYLFCSFESTVMILALSPQYGYVFLAATLVSFECLVFGFLFPGLARRKYFTADFMRQFD